MPPSPSISSRSEFKSGIASVQLADVCVDVARGVGALKDESLIDCRVRSRSRSCSKTADCARALRIDGVIGAIKAEQRRFAFAAVACDDGEIASVDFAGALQSDGDRERVFGPYELQHTLEMRLDFACAACRRSRSTLNVVAIAAAARLLVVK